MVPRDGVGGGVTGAGGGVMGISGIGAPMNASYCVSVRWRTFTRSLASIGVNATAKDGINRAVVGPAGAASGYAGWEKIKVKVVASVAIAKWTANEGVTSGPI